MTRRDLQCVHEPFGDAYYFGPERLGDRYEDDEKAREESGFANSTYRSIFDKIAKDNAEVLPPLPPSSRSCHCTLSSFVVRPGRILPTVCFGQLGIIVASSGINAHFSTQNEETSKPMLTKIRASAHLSKTWRNTGFPQQASPGLQPSALRCPTTVAVLGQIPMSSPL